MHMTNLSGTIRLTFVLIILCSIPLLFYMSSISIKNIREFLSSQKISLAIFPRSKTPEPTPLECPINGDKWIVVTTIFYPTEAIHRFLTLKSYWNLIVIADRKTPKDWIQRLTINTTKLLFLSIEQQQTLDFQILDYLPYGSYARKNLGYLIAIKCGAKIIFESDDDNLLETDDVYLLPKLLQPQQLPWIAFHRQRSPLINIYGSFGHPQIWPRGFPVDELRNVTEDGWHSVRQNTQTNTPAYIQQYLADLDPDVDAIVSSLLLFVVCS